MSVVAKTILQQLNGNMFLRMTGARQLTVNETTLSFRLPNDKGFVKNKINAVRIKLEDNDTYTVTFMRIWGTNINTISEVENVYADTLRSTFTSYTGLDVSFN